MRSLKKTSQLFLTVPSTFQKTAAKKRSAYLKLSLPDFTETGADKELGRKRHLFHCQPRESECMGVAFYNTGIVHRKGKDPNSLQTRKTQTRESAD